MTEYSPQQKEIIKRVRQMSHTCDELDKIKGSTRGNSAATILMADVRGQLDEIRKLSDAPGMEIPVEVFHQLSSSLRMVALDSLIGALSLALRLI